MADDVVALMRHLGQPVNLRLEAACAWILAAGDSNGSVAISVWT
jgi:hypothetical protein